MICRARGCLNEPMPTTPENPKGLCGRCHEYDEEYLVRLKPGCPKMSPETIAKRNAGRIANRIEREKRDALRAMA